MAPLGELADDLRESIGDGLSKLIHKRKRGHNENFGSAAQVGEFKRDRDNAGLGELHYTEHMPVRIPENKTSKRDIQAIQIFWDEGRSVVFDRHPSLRATHIRIQSPLIRDQLRTIIKGDYDLDFDNEDGLYIYAPFEPLYFARHEIWNRTKQLKDRKDENVEEEDPDATKVFDHMRLLIDKVLTAIMAELIEEAENLRHEKMITYNLLWTLFPHDSVVVAKDVAGYQQAYQVKSFTYISMTDESRVPVMFDMNCQYVHFDAYRFGFLTNNQTIGHFAGKKELKELDVIPFEAMPNPKELKRHMIERGQKMLLYQDVQHVQIRPVQLDNSRHNYDEMLKDLGRSDIHGRAIIDFFTGAKRNERWRRSVQPLDESRISSDTKPESAKSKGKMRMEEPPHDGEVVTDTSLAGASGKSSNRTITREELDSRKRPGHSIQEENTRLVKLDHLHSLLMCPLLHAFSLQSKQWITVNVESVAPVKFRSDAFDHLVAQERHKSRLLSLVRSQLLKSNFPGDPIPEKGRGLLVLLSGPPGTGKTLMAESIAEKAERPLYYVDARDLGTRIPEIASKFSEIMENAKEWNAVVLLDGMEWIRVTKSCYVAATNTDDIEADIYLQTRHTTADSRSSDRTTAFLRQLEYFQGILFLTTNLPHTIDPAIESRIHIHLPFPSLAQSFRVNIWQHFLATVPEELKQLTKADIRELGQWNINGRQIKNAFRMCGAYCQQERKKIVLQDLEDMIVMSYPSALKEPRDTAERHVDEIQPEDRLASETEISECGPQTPVSIPGVEDDSSHANDSKADLADTHHIRGSPITSLKTPLGRKRPPIPAKPPGLVSKLPLLESTDRSCGH